MFSRGDHDAIVQGLYAAAVGEASWRSALKSFADMFGTTGSLVRLQDTKGGTLGHETYPYSVEFAARYYASDVGRNDPRIRYFAAVRPGTVYFDHALYDVEEMNRDPRCRASNEVVGTKYSLGTVISLPDGATGFLALLSTEREGHATEAAVEAFGRLAPHMRQALSLGQIVDQRAMTQAALLDALARRADGVILLDRTGAPGFMNDAARAMLAAGDGLAYSQGEFVTLRGPETRRLRQLIGEVIAVLPASDARPGGELLVSRTQGRRPYVVRVMPARRMERFLTGASIASVIHLHDLAAVRVPQKSLLMAAFGLSEREADLAIALVRCAGLEGAATNAGMAHNTARRHLQGIFRKSGTASQAEAIQLLSRLA